MNSILANIFLLTQERLIQKVPALKWVDQELGQLDFYQMRPAVALPVCLIDFDSTSYSQESQAIQMAEGTLIIRLGLTAYSGTESRTPQAYKEKALEFYNIEHEVNRALHTWADSRFFSSFMRISAQTERREDNLRVRALRYQFAFQDNTAMPVANSIIARPDLELKSQ